MYEVNFRFVPMDFRILYMNVVSLAWNAVLSVLVNDDSASADDAKVAPLST